MIDMFSSLPFLYFLMGFIAVAGCIPFASDFAVRSGFIDAPGERKLHSRIVAPIGGLVIFPVAIGLHMFSGADLSYYWPLYVGVVTLMLIGALDDRLQLSAGMRFGVQLCIAALVVVVGACRLDQLGDLFSQGTFELGFMAIPFSIAAVALLINAMNLMDGLDGLASGQGLFALAALWGIAHYSGYAPFMVGLAPFVGALLGFWVHNMRSPLCVKARVFLGDSGTLSLGLVLAWFLIDGANQPNLPLEPICVAWFLAVPIMDECAQFYRRVREGRHPFSADRGHFHHHFIDAGFSHGCASFTILMLAALMGGGAYAYAAAGLPIIVLTILWIAALLAHMFVTAHKQGAYVAFLQYFTRSPE